MSTRWDPLRDSLIAADFHQVVPPDAFAEWEYINDRNTRVRFAPNVLLVEAVDGTAADDFDRAHRGACPSDHAIPDGGAEPERVTLIAGSDEAGKGERERSIAVAAVLMPRAMEGEALARGVRDSKSCTAAEVRELARWIESAFAHCTQAIHPSLRAEALHAHASNETRLLTAMHAHCSRAEMRFACSDARHFIGDDAEARAFELCDWCEALRITHAHPFVARADELNAAECVATT